MKDLNSILFFLENGFTLKVKQTDGLHSISATSVSVVDGSGMTVITHLNPGEYKSIVPNYRNAKRFTLYKRS